MAATTQIPQTLDAGAGTPPPARRRRRHHDELYPGRRKINWLLTAVLIVCSFSVLIPFYLAVVTALKSPEQMAASPWTLPSSWEWGNFAEAIDVVNFPLALRNSAIVTIGAVALTLATNSLVGWVIARNMNKRFFKFVFFFLLAAMFIPFPVIMLPLVKQTSMLHMDSLWGLMILYAIYNLPFNVLLYTGYVRSIPVELEEAAALDGAGPWRRFWKVVFPLLMPMNATVVILSTLGAWNDFLMPLVVLSDRNEYTLPLVQYAFQGQFNTQYNLAFASYLMALAPMILVYLVGQKWIIGGVIRGSVK
ncbi:MAG: carbohydrate ABC transporter permease [Cellulomonadaceae bacterium]